MRLAGKTAIVTGAGSGFGAGIAAKFVGEGAQVLVADINGDAASAVAGAIGARPWVVDVTDNTSVRRMAGKLPDPDIIVNTSEHNFALQVMEEVSDEAFSTILNVNAKSIFLMARHLVPKMKERGSGAILNVAATATQSPRPNQAWPDAAAGWIIAATKSMAAELSPHGIRVNAINPVMSPTPEDIGASAAFLCSDEARMINGIALDVDGERCN